MAQPKKKFTTAESMALVEIIGAPENKPWITNKGRETAITNKKKAAWARVLTTWHSTGQRQVALGLLTKKWDNLITMAKAAQQEARKSNKQTGGGPQGPQVSELAAKVLDVLGDLVLPLPNQFDSDKDHFNPDETVNLEAESEEPEVVDPIAGPSKGPSCLPEPATPKSRTAFILSKTRKRKASEETPGQKGQSEVMEMRKKEHELRMTIMESEQDAVRARQSAELMLLEARTAERDYWFRRTHQEFGHHQAYQ